MAFARRCFYIGARVVKKRNFIFSAMFVIFANWWRSVMKQALSDHINAL